MITLKFWSTILVFWGSVAVVFWGVNWLVRSFVGEWVAKWRARREQARVDRLLTDEFDEDDAAELHSQVHRIIAGLRL